MAASWSREASPQLYPSESHHEDWGKHERAQKFVMDWVLVPSDKSYQGDKVMACTRTCNLSRGKDYSCQLCPSLSEQYTTEIECQVKSSGIAKSGQGMWPPFSVWKIYKKERSLWMGSNWVRETPNTSWQLKKTIENTPSTQEVTLSTISIYNCFHIAGSAGIFPLIRDDSKAVINISWNFP